jgi:hypothetical protein
MMHTTVFAVVAIALVCNIVLAAGAKSNQISIGIITKYTIATNSINDNDSSDMQVYFTPPNDYDLREAEVLDVYIDDIHASTFVPWGSLTPEEDHHFIGHSSDGNTIHLTHYNGLLTGSMVMAREGLVYQFRPDAHGHNLVSATHSSKFAPEADADLDIQTRRMLRNRGVPAEPDSNILSYIDNVHRQLQVQTIDMMVVWTKKAECLNSKLAVNCTVSNTTQSNMQALVNLAIAETNVGFTQSGTNAQVRLVYSYREPNYVEPSMSTTLSHLSNKFDGNMDNVHSLRTQYGADVVSLIMHTTENICGQGYLGYPSPSAGVMFNVIKWNCATGYYSFGHELGHNFGCDHERADNKNCASNRTNFGYRNPNGLYRDIMSTVCAAGECDGVVTGKACTRLQFYSNAQNASFGPMGDARNNCVGQINAQVAKVAGFYPTVTTMSTATTATTTKATSTLSSPQLTASSYVQQAQVKTVSPNLQTKVSRVPTKAPTRTPTRTPTKVPSRVPTKSPTPTPTSLPTLVPTTCGNSACEPGESCVTCPLDCSSQVVAWAVCGNGVCEAADGETFYTCPVDCRGDTNSTYFCGVNGTCDNVACNQESYACTTTSAGSVETCCGDGICSIGETVQTCSIDCFI